MKRIEVNKKCAVCGALSRQYAVASRSSFIANYVDFDLKPNREVTSREIQECEKCGYCNYDISKIIDKKFENNYDAWFKDKEIQTIMAEYEGIERQVLLLAIQYKNVRDYKNLYEVMLDLYWIDEEYRKKGFINAFKEKIKRSKVNELINYNGRTGIINIFNEKIMPTHIAELLQYADILRQDSKFKESKNIIEAVKLLNNDNEDISKIIEAELQFNNNSDNKRHNLFEIN